MAGKLPVCGGGGSLVLSPGLVLSVTGAQPPPVSLAILSHFDAEGGRASQDVEQAEVGKASGSVVPPDNRAQPPRGWGHRALCLAKQGLGYVFQRAALPTNFVRRNANQMQTDRPEQGQPCSRPQGPVGCPRSVPRWQGVAVVSEGGKLCTNLSWVWWSPLLLYP